MICIKKNKQKPLRSIVLGGGVDLGRLVGDAETLSGVCGTAAEAGGRGNGNGLAVLKTGADDIWL